MMSTTGEPRVSPIYPMYPSSYSARETAVTQRLPSTAILAIDSEDRFKDYADARTPNPALSNRSPYSFAITKNQALLNGFFTRLGVTEVVFPWAIPNINRFTDTIIFQYDISGGGSGVEVITLPVGFYTPSMIASAIQALVRTYDAGLSGFTMTYGVKTIDQTSPSQMPIFEYKTNNPNAQVEWRPVTAATPGQKQLFDILGFSDRNSVFDVEDGGEATYCQSSRYVDIVCTQLTGNQALKDSMSQQISRDVLCRIYVGDAQGVQSTVLPSASTFCPPGCMPTTVYKNFSQPKQIQWAPNQPVAGYLQFDVYDDAGFPLSQYAPLQSGGAVSASWTSNSVNWSLTLLISEN